MLLAVALALLLACAQCLRAAAAQEPAALPALNRPVTDLTATLDAAQTARLEESLRAFEQRKGSQIAVLIVKSTQPEAIEQFAIRLAEQWKIGRKKVDDGAILIVAKDDRALRIEVGYGLEGALNDATSKRIIEEAITPRFRNGDFYGGIAAGLDGMMKVIDGEPLPPPSRAGQAGRAGQSGQFGFSGGIGQMLPVALVAAVVLGGVLRAVLGRFAGAAVTGGVIGVGAFLMAGVLAAALAGGIAFLFTLLGGGRAGRSHGGWVGGGLGGLGGLGGGFGGGGGGGCAVLGLEVLRRPGLRGAARGVEAVQLLPIPQDAERIAAQAVAHGLHQRHHGGGGHGGIHRVATLLQDAQTGLRGQRVRGGHHVACEHRDAGREVRVLVVELHAVS
eukprot:gene32601-40230_t